MMFSLIWCVSLVLLFISIYIGNQYLLLHSIVAYLLVTWFSCCFLELTVNFSWSLNRLILFLNQSLNTNVCSLSVMDSPNTDPLTDPFAENNLQVHGNITLSNFRLFYKLYLEFVTVFGCFLLQKFYSHTSCCTNHQSLQNLLQNLLENPGRENLILPPKYHQAMKIPVMTWKWKLSTVCGQKLNPRSRFFFP